MELFCFLQDDILCFVFKFQCPVHCSVKFFQGIIHKIVPGQHSCRLEFTFRPCDPPKNKGLEYIVPLFVLISGFNQFIEFHFIVDMAKDIEDATIDFFIFANMFQLNIVGNFLVVRVFFGLKKGIVFLQRENNFLGRLFKDGNLFGVLACPTVLMFF